jgi:hypothetical protein
VKAAAKGQFKTRAMHKTLRGIMGSETGRAPGYRPAPVLVRLDPEPGVAPSAAPPVRIYVGTEPSQYRAERVFVWSIKKVRDPSRAYEIYLMKDLEGFDRTSWKTGFTNYRYAVPALAGGSGRAIYNDVDQIYLADPAELFDMDMNGKGVLSIDDKETSVMLIDCAKLAPLWKLEETHTLQKHKHYRALAHDAGLWGHMPAVWNARDHEYAAGASKLLHFTILHTQPWEPFPELLRYEPNANARVWTDLEQEADAARFTLFTKAAPSARYLELLNMYATMHEEGRPETGHTAKETFSGISLVEHVEPVARLIRETDATSLLDFGAGKGRMYEDDPAHEAGGRHKLMKDWPGVAVTCYDPGYEPFSGPYEGHYDGVITTDVLEHIPEEDIAWVLDDLFAQAQKFVYAVAACYPAKKKMPDGSNAHCTQQPPSWWEGQMILAARRHPGIRWVLCTQEKSALAFQQRKKLTKKGVRSRFFEGRG